MGGESKTKIVKDFGGSTTIHGLNYMINAEQLFDRLKRYIDRKIVLNKVYKIWQNITNSNMYNLKWKISDIKRTPVKKKNIFPPKMASENTLKQCGVHL